MDWIRTLELKIQQGSATLGVVGIGRVGLPLALVFAQSGIKVVGFDNDRDYVKAISQGNVPFTEQGMGEIILQPNFEAAYITEAVDRLNACDIFIFCVGTPLNHSHHVDYSQLFNALSSALQANIKGKFIILRSTVPPRTLEERVIPFIESKTGLKAGIDFGAASCPERVLEGYAIEEIVTLPEIVGGINPECTEIAVSLFTKINASKIFHRTTPVSAELAKLYSNMYRYVNFALANEFALLAEEFRQDATEIIRAVNEGYPRNGIPKPGLVGGPCLTKDGYFLLSSTAFPDFIMLASRLNEFMPQHIVNRLRARLVQKGGLLHAAKIGLLGLAFKAESDDVRDSPSAKIMELLKSENAEVTVHDPYIQWTSSLQDTVRNADAVILATNHPQFHGIEKKIFELRKNRADCIIVDCWSMLDRQALLNLGFDYIKLGRKDR